MRNYPDILDYRNIVFMFAYGMNTNLTSMFLRLTNAKLLGKAVLPGHRLEFRYHLDIVESKSDVEGVLWKLRSSDLELIDQIEGYPDYYTRSVLQIRRGYFYYPAWTYEMQDKSKLQEPDPNYWNLVLNGYLENNIDTKPLYKSLDRAKNQLTLN